MIEINLLQAAMSSWDPGSASVTTWCSSICIFASASIVSNILLRLIDTSNVGSFFDKKVLLYWSYVFYNFHKGFVLC